MVAADISSLFSQLYIPLLRDTVGSSDGCADRSLSWPSPLSRGVWLKMSSKRPCWSPSYLSYIMNSWEYYRLMF